MRDALSLLDQLIAFGGGKVDEASARGMLGTIDRDHVTRLARALATGDAAQLIETARTLEEFSPDYGQVLDDLAALLTRVALQQLVSGYEGDELFDPALVKELAAAISAEDVQLYYQTAILGRRDLPFAPDPRTGFEMTLVRMLAFRPAAARRESSLPAERRACDSACHEFRRSVAGGRGHRAAGIRGSHRSGAVVARHRRSRRQRRGSPARDQLRARRTPRQHAEARGRSAKSRARRRRSKGSRRRWRNISAGT